MQRRLNRRRRPRWARRRRGDAAAQPEHVGLLGHLMSKVGAVAEAAGLDDYRVVVNDGAGAGQTVFHLHVHVIGGRELAWPPG